MDNTNTPEHPLAAPVGVDYVCVSDGILTLLADNMVKVKMDYNPYLMETKAKFNNKEPRINSLFEKYYQSLQ